MATVKVVSLHGCAALALAPCGTLAEGLEQIRHYIAENLRPPYQDIKSVTAHGGGLWFINVGHPTTIFIIS